MHPEPLVSAPFVPHEVCFEGGMLRRHLVDRGVEPEACRFRLVAVRPIHKEVRSPGRAEHDQRRDVVAAMEKALAEALAWAGCRVMNRTASRKSLDAARFAQVRAAFAHAFPHLPAKRSGK